MANELTMEQELQHHIRKHKVRVLTEYFQCLVAQDLMMQQDKLRGISDADFDKMVRILAKGYIDNLITNSSMEEINHVYEEAWEELKEHLP